jgi:hypothetical protein
MRERVQVRICKCSKPFKVRVSSKRKLCNECLYKRVLRASTELHNKKGRDYRRWIKALAESIERAKRGIR